MTVVIAELVVINGTIPAPLEAIGADVIADPAFPAQAGLAVVYGAIAAPFESIRADIIRRVRNLVRRGRLTSCLAHCHAEAEQCKSAGRQNGNPGNPFHG